jgi:hypothetical protein
VDRLHKSETFTDGAVESKVKQLETKSGSGQSGEVPKHTMTEGSFVDGAQKAGIDRDLNSKAGSGANVSEEYANVTHQTGKHFNDGAVDKVEMQKCPMPKGTKGGTPMRGSPAKGKSVAPSKKAKGVPNPKGGDVSSKTSKKK